MAGLCDVVLLVTTYSLSEMFVIVAAGHKRVGEREVEAGLGDGRMRVRPDWQRGGRNK